MDVHSLVTLSQQFHNRSNLTANQVTYTFSMLASAAICAFEMVRADGTKVAGVAKEKEQAQRELKSALDAGKTAALGEEQTKDIFSICVGNVLPNETITINLSYINALTDDENPNQIRFTLPRAYLQRYGTAPTDKITEGTRHEDIPFTMDVFISQAGRVRSVSSPAYNMSLDLGRPANIPPSAGPDENFATVAIRRSDVSGPSKDVVLVITADGLDKPRAFIADNPFPDQETTAIGVTLVPQFRPIEAPNGMEYIVLVDRSGSMDGVKLKMTQAALVVLLKNLPSENSYFNVFSYGTNVTSLWPKSKLYDQITVDEATKHINAMKADYGGKEIAKALDAVYNSLPPPLARPVSIFLLTDGGAWNVKECMAKTEKAIRDRATNTAFMRVFTAGMGDGVSTETCDGIARAGGGMSTYILTPNEPYMGKCARLVRAARTAPVTNVEVTWQAPQPPRGPSVAPGATINLFQPDVNYDTGDTGAVARVQQAPHNLPSFFPSTRFQVYAIVPKGTALRDPEIKIKGYIPATGNPIELPVTVRNLSDPAGRTIINISAAKALITDAEDGTAPGTPDELKADIIRKGIAYGLTSRYTSLIAIDNGQRPARPVGVGRTVTATSFVATPDANTGSSEPPETGSASPPATRGLTAEIATMSFAAFSAPPEAVATRSFDISTASFTGWSDGNDEDGDDDLAEEPPDSNQAVLYKLARWQQFDGGFASKADFATDLLISLGGDTAQPVLDKFSLSGEVAAVFLAWAWLRLCGGEEAEGMKEKADSWLRASAQWQGLDIDAIQRELLDVITFLPF
ncbi:hypothetical protein BV22DRAFT_1030448 [Leucogyrophana mollusca]|uniref:Uncharacterized protein n=1 Tax=Leucogyrophana mollusca TaxID=85980 RepID=A0ACB8BTA5_9AGAM|nr:hypothetical protein BV22DRAFT_1030448 [Leucogyrophana mollusca]